MAIKQSSSEQQMTVLAMSDDEFDRLTLDLAHAEALTQVALGQADEGDGRALSVLMVLEERIKAVRAQVSAVEGRTKATAASEGPNATIVARARPGTLPPLTLEQANVLEELLYDLEGIFNTSSVLAKQIPSTDETDEISYNVVMAALTEKGAAAVGRALEIWGEAHILVTTRDPGPAAPNSAATGAPHG